MNILCLGYISFIHLKSQCVQKSPIIGVACSSFEAKFHTNTVWMYILFESQFCIIYIIIVCIKKYLCICVFTHMYLYLYCQVSHSQLIHIFPFIPSKCYLIYSFFWKYRINLEFCCLIKVAYQNWLVFPLLSLPIGFSYIVS